MICKGVHPPSPPPRGESARGSAAAAIFPPLRTHGARGRNAVAQPPSSLSPGKGPPCRRRCPPAPAFAADSARQAPGSGPRCRPGARPGAAAALAFCFLRSGAPAPARALQGTQRAPPAGPGKTAARARARLRDRPPPSSSPRARALLAARRRRLAGGRGGGRRVCGRGAPLCSRTPPEVEREGEAGGRRREKSARSGRGGGSYVGGGASCRLDSPIRAGGVCARRTCEITEPRAGTCGEYRHVRCAPLLAA